MLTADQRNALARLHQKYPNHYMEKFLRTREAWVEDARSRAARLSLVGAKPLRILDIGCGVPYFAIAARELGHEVVGLDVPDEVIREAAQIMGFAYIGHTIDRLEALPPLGGPYDLVTMFGVNLRHPDMQWWRWDEWAELIRVILAEIVRGGRLVIQPNTGPYCSELLMDAARWRLEDLPASVEIAGAWLIFVKE